MSVLKRRVANDGTFCPTKPLDLLVGKQTSFSFDLKSATDRWPLLMMFYVIQSCFDQSFASSVVNTTLACNVFHVPFVKRKESVVSFVTGQPLGRLGSSWPLFALSHHLLVWDCAEQVYPGPLFSDYAVL